jgi:hypothetical protein
MSTFFIDESKARGYTVVAAIVLPSEVAPLRRSVDELRMRGQRRLHFAKESDQRRRAILSTLQAAQVHGIAYQAHERDDLASRTLCLEAVVVDALRLGVTRIVLEQDDSIVSHDRQVLFTALRRAARTDITYEHARAATEPLLALPDAIAWAIARGGDWRRRVNPMIDSLQRLP